MRLRSRSRLLMPLLAAVLLPGQELQPRAYVPAPLGLTFASLGYSNNSGGLLFDPSLPIEDSHVNARIATLGLGRTLGLFGRSSQLLVVLPYVFANLSGKFMGVDQSRYRSGLADSTFRFAMNIHGAPAMRLEEYAKYRPKTIIGASLTVTAPTGQYDPNRLINIGTNRWAFKPELGVVRFRKKWEFEGAFGAWLYTKNSSFFGGRTRTQDPLGSIQTHIVRLLSRKTWFAFDGTIYMGGRSFIGSTVNADYTSNTRFGATFGISITPRQALKIAYFNGATTRVGNDISSISIAYQWIWQAGLKRRAGNSSP